MSEAQLNLEKLKKIFKELREPFIVKVGVLGAKAMKKPEVQALENPRNKGKFGRAKLGSITVAGIGTTQEFGSLKHNIPKRSFLKEPITENLPKKLGEFKMNFDDIKDNYRNLGMLAKGVVLEAFDTSFNNKWKENAEITLKGGWMKNKVSGRMFKVQGKEEDNKKGKSGGSSPLIHQGLLRKSIGFRVERN
ncbi:hypothetical protein FACS1894152_1690 [Bacilli bacterium]|nr:hypothetical protein FACS1894152_1690 [Bacilli bacterium]